MLVSHYQFSFENKHSGVTSHFRDAAMYINHKTSFSRHTLQMHHLALQGLRLDLPHSLAAYLKRCGHTLPIILHFVQIGLSFPLKHRKGQI